MPLYYLFIDIFSFATFLFSLPVLFYSSFSLYHFQSHFFSHHCIILSLFFTCLFPSLILQLSLSLLFVAFLFLPFHSSSSLTTLTPTSLSSFLLFISHPLNYFFSFFLLIFLFSELWSYFLSHNFLSSLFIIFSMCSHCLFSLIHYGYKERGHETLISQSNTTPPMIFLHTIK